MARSASTDGGRTNRTETTRHADDVSGHDVIEGDRIDKQLVARTFGQLGERVRPDDDAPETQLVSLTAINRMDDTHSALLADPETGVIIRAGRHDSQQAWSQAEADWTVYEVGTSVVIEEVHLLELTDRDDPVEEVDVESYVEGWAEVVIEDPANGHDDYSDERELDGRTLSLRDVDGRSALATISLADDE